MFPYVYLMVAQALLHSCLALPGHSTSSVGQLNQRSPQINNNNNQTSTGGSQNGPSDPFILPAGNNQLIFTNFRGPKADQDMMQTFLFDLELAVAEEKKREGASSSSKLWNRVFYYEDLAQSATQNQDQNKNWPYFKLQAEPTVGDRLKWTDVEAAVLAFRTYFKAFQNGEAIPTVDLVYTAPEHGLGRVFGSGELGMEGLSPVPVQLEGHAPYGVTVGNETS